MVDVDQLQQRVADADVHVTLLQSQLAAAQAEAVQGRESAAHLLAEQAAAEGNHVRFTPQMMHDFTLALPLIGDNMLWSSPVSSKEGEQRPWPGVWDPSYSWSALKWERTYDDLARRVRPVEGKGRMYMLPRENARFVPGQNNAEGSRGPRGVAFVLSQAEVLEQEQRAVTAGKERILRLQERVEALESELVAARTSLETFKVADHPTMPYKLCVPSTCTRHLPWQASSQSVTPQVSCRSQMLPTDTFRV